MQERTWFDDPRRDGSTITTVMDDIAITADEPPLQSHPKQLPLLRDGRATRDADGSMEERRPFAAPRHGHRRIPRGVDRNDRGTVRGGGPVESSSVTSSGKHVTAAVSSRQRTRRESAG